MDAATEPAREPVVTLVDRAAGFLESKISRRGFVTRAAFVGSAVAAGGADFVLRPGSAYAAICSCGDPACGCGTTCCAGYTEFCCVINGGANSCPAGTVMGGWWKADGSSYCAGPRYYMDCNATCHCTNGCGGGFQFCDPGCDGLSCGCAAGTCDNYLTGCFQFRYGQCNQDVSCLGRIECRVVSCVPPWEIDPSCTTVAATDDFTAQQNAPCLQNAPQPGGPIVGLAGAGPSGAGYWVVSSLGHVSAYGAAANHGDLTSVHLNQPVIGIASTATGKGYWLLASDGGIFSFGDARFYGSTGSIRLNKPVVGMAATPSGNGYWLVASDGGVFCFGDARFYGSTGSMRLNQPVVGMAPAPGGRGYWLVASDGGIFAFGQAPFHGSTGSIRLNKPVVGMAATPTGKGYWMVATDGGIFAFGDARFEGSEGGQAIPAPIVGMDPDGTGGYWLVASDGKVFNFGGAPYLGAPA
jgi:hypothetical protein